MKKNNNSLLLTILGGAIFCFVFLGMAFIFTNSTRIMSGNNTPSLENNEEGISLGDENCTCPDNYPVHSGGYCYGTPYTPSYMPSTCDDLPNVYNVNGHCYSARVSETCSTEPTTPVITCISRTYNKSTQIIASCLYGDISNHTRVNAGSQIVVCRNDTHGTEDTKSCSISKASGSTGVNPTGFNLNIGETRSITSNGATGTLSYSSSNNSIATVNGSGVVTAVGAGNATITITAASSENYNSASSTVGVLVNVSTASETGSISVAPQAKIFIAKDMPVTLTFAAKGTDGNPIPVTWPDPGNSLITKNCSSKQATCSYTFNSNTCGSYSMEKSATDESGNSLVMPKITAKKYNAWSSGSKKTTTTQPTERSRESMKWKEGCDAIENVTKIEEGKWEYTLYNRCCSGGSGTTSPKCYVDEQGAYHWTADKEPSWQLVSGVSNKDFCEAQEKDACYRAPDGEYEWGKYAKTEGYTYIASIKNETTCKETGVCYKNNAGDYEYAETKPDACVQVNSCWVPNAEASNPPETCTYTTKDACEEVEGYVEVPDVDKNACLPDAQEACYIRESDGKWSWGDYSNVTGYYPLQYEDGTPVPEEMCSNDVPDVPKTNMNVTQIVYICMAVLMACGVGFIYYSSVMKKNENQ